MLVGFGARRSGGRSLCCPRHPEREVSDGVVSVPCPDCVDEELEAAVEHARLETPAFTVRDFYYLP